MEGKLDLHQYWECDLPQQSSGEQIASHMFSETFAAVKNIYEDERKGHLCP